MNRLHTYRSNAEYIRAKCSPSASPSTRSFSNASTASIMVVGSSGNRLSSRRFPVPGSPGSVALSMPSSPAAVMPAAGLEGIERATDPGEPGTGNLLEDKRFPLLPTTMIEAVEAFEKDRVLGEALGEHFARMYSALLRYVWRRFMSYVTDWEIQEYRDLL